MYWMLPLGHRCKSLWMTGQQAWVQRLSGETGHRAGAMARTDTATSRSARALRGHAVWLLSPTRWVGRISLTAAAQLSAAVATRRIAQHDPRQPKRRGYLVRGVLVITKIVGVDPLLCYAGLRCAVLCLR